jgi:uncharacterized membrane protein SpoIIM required for sporulation
MGIAMYVEKIYNKKIFIYLLDQNITEIPIIVVVLGCAGGLLFLIDILILVSNRTRGKN